MNLTRHKLLTYCAHTFLISLITLSANAESNTEALVETRQQPSEVVITEVDNMLSTELIELDHKPNAPSFTLPDMHDKPRQLSDYKGKPVIISFWATWCPPCRKEIPYFNRAYEKLENDGVTMLFVNINEGKETIENYIKEHPIKMEILRDEGAGQLQNWNMTGLPTTFILNPEGQVVYQAMGERAWDDDAILDKVRALSQSTQNGN